MSLVRIIGLALFAGIGQRVQGHFVFNVKKFTHLRLDRAKLDKQVDFLISIVPELLSHAPATLLLEEEPL